MGMTKCPTCSRDVSTEAAACPSCGHQFKSAGGINLRDPVHFIGVVVTVLFFVGLVVGAIAMAR